MYGAFNWLVIANRYSQDDHNIVALGPQFQIEYNRIEEAFYNGNSLMVFLKNIIATLVWNCFLCIEMSIILATIQDDYAQMHLSIVHQMMCNKGALRGIFY